MDLNPKTIVIKSFIWKFLEKCCVQGVSFIISIVIARLVLPEEFGIVALVAVFTNIANVIVEGGMSTALIQKKNADNIDFSTVFYLSIFVSLILYVILYLTSPLIAYFYNMSSLVLIIRIIGISILFGGLNSVQRAYVSKYMLFNKLFKCSIISILISGFIGIIMAFKGFGVWALVTQSTLSQILNTITMWFFVRWRPLLSFSKERFLILFDFGWKILASNMLISLFVNIRSLLIGKYFLPSSLAYFDRGKHLPSLIMENINSSIQTILLPVLSEQQDNRSKVKSMLRRSIKTSSLFIFPLLIGFIVCAESLTILLLTEKWLPIVPFIRIFSIAYMLMPIQIANMEAIKAMGCSSMTLKLESYKKILEVLVLLLSFLGGVIGIAWGVVVYNIMCLFINLYPSKKLFDYGYIEQINDILNIFIIALIMGVSIYILNFISFLSTSPILLLGTQIVMGCIIYSLLCYLFRLEGFMYIINMIKSHSICYKS